MNNLETRITVRPNEIEMTDADLCSKMLGCVAIRTFGFTFIQWAQMINP